MKNETYLSEDQLVSQASQHIRTRVVSILDIGCGIKPQQYTKALHYIYVEPFEDYIPTLQEIIKDIDGTHHIYNLTWAEALQHIPDGSVDTIVLKDVIEHFEKEEGLRLLQETIKKAKKQIVVFTPLGFLKQEHEDGKDAWGFNGGQWQEHKSGWLPEDFDESWEFFICENYHKYNNVGEAYDHPAGAFFAIKTIEE